MPYLLGTVTAGPGGLETTTGSDSTEGTENMLDDMAQSSAPLSSILSNTKFFRSLSPAARAVLESRGMVSPGLGVAPGPGLSAGCSAPGDLLGSATSKPGASVLGKNYENTGRKSESLAAPAHIPGLAEFSAQSNLQTGRVAPAGFAPARLEALPVIERKVYHQLARLCRAHALSEGRKLTAVYVLHTSAELLMDSVGVRRTRFYEALHALSQAGLIAHKGFTVRLSMSVDNGRCVSSGTLFAVLTDPESSVKPRLRFFDYHWMYRDMLQVLKTKTSVHNFRKRNEQTLESLEAEDRYQILERYTLSGRLSIHTVTPSSVCSLSGKEFVFALASGKFLRSQDRGQWVQDCADRLAALLRDQSVNLYRWLLWKLLKASDQGLDLWSFVQAAVVNVLGDQVHDVPTNYGAVLVRKLKISGIWEDLAAVR